jgi:hypothetical protein
VNVSVRTSTALVEHLNTFEHDGGTVAGVLFEGGRLAYPARKEIETMLGYTDPYTIELEARVIEGMSTQWNAAVRFLSRLATEQNRGEQTLDLLWSAHHSFMYPEGTANYKAGAGQKPSIDRLVAALVTIKKYEELLQTDHLVLSVIVEASEVVVGGLHAVGLPPTMVGLEELFDGADPACVALGLVSFGS